MVDITGELGSEVQSSPWSQGTYSQTSGLVVKSVNLCRVDYCILCTRQVLVTGVASGASRTRKQFESAATSFSRIFFGGSGGGSISVGPGFLVGWGRWGGMVTCLVPSALFEEGDGSVGGCEALIVVRCQGTRSLCTPR